MKKLKPWQIVLLVIFYPVGIIYLIVWLVERNKQNAAVPRVKASDLEIIREFHSKVVGVTYENDDGTSRQEILKTCSTGEDIILKPLSVPGHPEAVGVFRKNGQQLGFLSAELASAVRKEYAHNPMSVQIAGLTGGGGYARGCNLRFTIYAVPNGAKCS